MHEMKYVFLHFQKKLKVQLERKHIDLNILQIKEVLTLENVTKRGCFSVCDGIALIVFLKLYTFRIPH